MSLELVVDARVLDDRHLGVRDYWMPLLVAYARSGRRCAAAVTSSGTTPESLRGVGFAEVVVGGDPRRPRASGESARRVRASGARVALSPLYLTLTGAPRLVATVFDLVGRTHPLSLASRAMWEIAMRRVARRADVVVCAGPAAAAQIGDSFPALRDRLRVVSPFLPSAPLPPPLPLVATPYALAVATHRPHKRLAELATAWRRRAPGAVLVLAGRGTEHLDDRPWIRGFGWVADDDVQALRANAACLLSASAAEGFGLPVLAALAQGIPVIACRLPALAEFAGDAAVWCEADDIDQLVDHAVAIVKGNADVPALVRRGRNQAALFHPERSLRELDAALGR